MIHSYCAFFPAFLSFQLTRLHPHFAANQFLQTVPGMSPHAAGSQLFRTFSSVHGLRTLLIAPAHSHSNGTVSVFGGVPGSLMYQPFQAVSQPMMSSAGDMNMHTTMAKGQDLR
jgi:hypothetical protein